MKLTRDEAGLLADALYVAKYEFFQGYRDIEGLHEAINDLEKRLREEGQDKRRTGRTSMDTSSDMLKRLVKKGKK